MCQICYDKPEIFKDFIERHILKSYDLSIPYSERIELDDYSECTVSNQIRIKVRGEDVSFDMLEKLSRLLDTKNINFENITEESGYCETCWSSDSYVVIECSDVRFDISQPQSDDTRGDIDWNTKRKG